LKIDYRMGVSPQERTTKCETAIRNALRQGKKTFGNLLKETKMSRSTLASHLKEMYKKRHVERETDPKDYRITYYSLTSKGRGELRRQEDIDTLVSSPEIIVGLTDALIKFLEPSIRHYIITLEEKDSNLLKECITYSIYSDSSLKNEVRDYARELTELAAKSMLSEFAIPTRRQVIKKMPNISLVFKFDWDKIEKYLQTVEDERNKEPLPKLPDVKDYPRKQKEEK